MSTGNIIFIIIVVLLLGRTIMGITLAILAAIVAAISYVITKIAGGK